MDSLSGETKCQPKSPEKRSYLPNMEMELKSGHRGLEFVVRARLLGGSVGLGTSRNHESFSLLYRQGAGAIFFK